jgi:hypothetical protein
MRPVGSGNPACQLRPTTKQGRGSRLLDSVGPMQEAVAATRIQVFIPD